MTIASRIEFAFGADLTADPATWSWTDVSARSRGEVRLMFGAADEGQQTQPTRVGFRLDNVDSRFSPRHPSSIYYPNVRRQTPVRISMNPGTGYTQRFQGYADEIVPVWPEGNDSIAEVLVSASGILRRLGQGVPALESPMRRCYPRTNPVAYWPLEDGVAAVRAESAVAGGTAMYVKPGTYVAFASAAGPPGSAAVPTFSANGVGGTLVGAVPSGGSPNDWRVEFSVKCNALDAGAFNAVLQWQTLGTIATWEIDVSQLVDGGLYLQWITAAGAAGGPLLTNVAVDDGQWHNIVVTGEQIGGGLNVVITIDNGTANSILITTTTLGAVKQAVINPTGIADESAPSVAHLVVWAPFASAIDPYEAFTAYVGETAGARITRIAAEEGITASVSSTSGTATMGPQAIATALAILRDCETVDGGLLYDGFNAGITYTAAQDRMSLAATMALDTRRQQVKLPFSPTEDDQRVRNQWTVSRLAGGSQTVVGTEHVAANNGVVYADAATVNVALDTQLVDEAGWRVNLGTVEEMRVPGLVLQLIDHPELWAPWLAMRPGKRMTCDNLPAQYPPGTLDMALEGANEVWDATSWRVEANTGPYAPWRVAVFAADTGDTGEFVGRFDTGGSALIASATATAGTLYVATTSGGSEVWTTVADDLPLDVGIAGERVTATNITSMVRDTFVPAASSGWGTADSGQAWSVGAGTASLFSNAAGLAHISVSAINTEHHIALDMGYAPYQRVRVYNTVGVTPTGAGINWGVMLRRADASNLYWIDVQIGTDSSLTLRVISKIAGANVQLASQLSATTHSTSVNRILVADIDDNDVIRAKVYADGATEPRWELVYQASNSDLQTGTTVGCICRLMTGNTNTAPVDFVFDNFAVLNPQEFTVTRSVNTVSKAQAAGAAVALWNPPIFAK